MYAAVTVSSWLWTWHLWRRDLAWGPEGGWLKSSTEHSMECGLIAGEVPVHLLGTAEVPLSNSPTSWSPLYVAALSLWHLSTNAYLQVLTFPLAPPWGWHLWFWVKTRNLDNCWMDCLKFGIDVVIRMNCYHFGGHEGSLNGLMRPPSSKYQMREYLVNGGHPSSRVPETCWINSKAHWSCSGGMWWPKTLQKHVMLVFPFICCLSV